MIGYLSHVVAHAQGREATLRPRPRSRFEPGDLTASWEEAPRAVEPVPFTERSDLAATSGVAARDGGPSTPNDAISTTVTTTSARHPAGASTVAGHTPAAGGPTSAVKGPVPAAGGPLSAAEEAVSPVSAAAGASPAPAGGLTAAGSVPGRSTPLAGSSAGSGVTYRASREHVSTTGGSGSPAGEPVAMEGEFLSHAGGSGSPAGESVATAGGRGWAAEAPVPAATGPASAVPGPGSPAPQGGVTNVSDGSHSVRRASPAPAGGPTAAGTPRPGQDRARAPWEDAAATVEGGSATGHATPVTGSSAGSGVTSRPPRPGMVARGPRDAPAAVDEVGSRLRPPQPIGRGRGRSGGTEPAEAQVVNVTIGRVEVRNPLPPVPVPQPVAADPGPRPLSLDEYLDRRNRS